MVVSILHGVHHLLRDSNNIIHSHSRLFGSSSYAAAAYDMYIFPAVLGSQFIRWAAARAPFVSLAAACWVQWEIALDGWRDREEVGGCSDWGMPRCWHNLALLRHHHAFFTMSESFQDSNHPKLRTSENDEESNTVNVFPRGRINMSSI